MIYFSHNFFFHRTSLDSDDMIYRPNLPSRKIRKPGPQFSDPVPVEETTKSPFYFRSNTYRVISQNAEGIPTSRKADGKGSHDPPHLVGMQVADIDHRRNNPNPRNVNFLRTDVRLLNEPVCDVKTKSTMAEQHLWYAHQYPSGPNPQPQKPAHSTSRGDYQYRGIGIKACGRFSGNTRQSVANGIG